MNKAENVKQVHYDAKWVANFSNLRCYSEAVDTAYELGGIEIYNSNDGNSSWSFAPSRTFEFDDASRAHVTYSGVYA